ncbi:MAG: c-type cytochrome [Anaerolineales bacterium]|nr:c-type cytochrome [Anaerolineales bacterium]
MTLSMKITGFVATLVILIIIPVYFLQESGNQAAIQQAYIDRSVENATDLYAENCVVCHGASGEGISTIPALDTEALRTMPEETLYKIISRGVDGTQMAAWDLEEGGILTRAQIQELTTLILNPSWKQVELRVADLGLTPPTPAEMEVTNEMVSALQTLEGSEDLILGLTVYAENCAACHAANGEGTSIAPALNTEEVRQKALDDLIAIVQNGVSGTLMASWKDILTPEKIDASLTFILRWPEIENSGVEFPEIEVPVFESTPEMIAAGDRLFHIACKSCHGTDAYGTPMAPSLNNPTFLGETPDAAIYQIIAGGVPDTLMPAWGARLSEQDLNSLVAFIRSLEENTQPILQP